jgi:Tol biopolymer transport system component
LYAVRLDQAPVANPVRVAKFDTPPNPSLSLRWTNDGIIASLNFSDDNVFRVAMDPNTGRSVGALERLTHESRQSTSPSISPNGAQVAFWADRGLAVMDAPTGAHERIVTAHPPGAVYSPVKWRSSEEVITKRRRPNTESDELITIDIRTGVVEPLLIQGRTPEPLLIQSGAWDYARATDSIVYVARLDGPLGGRTIRERLLADGTDRIVATIDETEGLFFDLRLSPDGRHIAYLINNRLTRPPKNDEMGVITIGATGRHSLRTLPAGVPAAWSPNGRFLLYGAARPRVVDTVTGASWTLMAPPDQPAWGEDGWASWSTDGSFIVLAVESARSETRMWKGVTADTVSQLTSGRGGVR